MSSAVHFVFAIPEMLALVSSFLDRHDLSRLMRTSQLFYTTITPLFYRDIDLRVTPPCRLAYSRKGLQALTRNAHLVKGVRMDDKFFDRYYECLTTATASGQLKDDMTGTGAQGKGTPTTVNALFPSAVITAPAVNALGDILFPRMTNLSRFDYNLPVPGEDWNDAEIRYTDKAGLVLSKFSLMVPPAQALLLTSLTLNGPLIKHQRDLNGLTRIVAGLSNLKTLRLGIDYSEELMDDLVPRIFFSLPSSIQVFVIREMSMGGNRKWEVQGRDDTTPTAEEAYRRDGSFLELKDFDVELGHLISPHLYFLMLPYCPELEFLSIPQIIERRDEERLAQFIVTHCPKLKRLSRMDPGFEGEDEEEEDEEEPESLYGNYDGVLLKLTSKAMPKDTMESFCYDGFYESHGLHRARLVSFLSNQFQSLKEVHLWNCYSLCGFSVTQLLHFSPVLESLVIENGASHEVQYNVNIELQCLSSVSWASCRFREFRLAVNMGHLSLNNFPFAFSLPRLHRDVMATSFGGLMANIGKQKNLRILDLRVALPRQHVHQNMTPWTYRDEAFPGLLTLNSRSSNGQGQRSGQGDRLRRGFLEMLGGLSKLEELRGSVNLIPRNAYGYTTGWDEAKWMRKHWPKLKVAEFYPAKAESTFAIADEFLWLQKQLPGLVVTDSH